MHLARTLSRADLAPPSYCSKSEQSRTSLCQKRESRATGGEYSGRAGSPNDDQRFGAITYDACWVRCQDYAAPPQSCVLGLARHAAALHRVALDLQIALPRFPHLRRIAEHAAALAAEALIARRGRGFHEIVVSILLRNLVDHARALVEELLLATVLLHALKDVLHSVYGGVSFDASPLRQGVAGKHHRQRSAKRNSVGRRHAPSLILKCNLHEARC